MNLYRRQEELKVWNQEVIGNLTCLVLGVGGLGTNICVNLCRLGVKKIIMVDMDVVDDHNLNRQILYRKEHVGKLKIDSAIEELRRHNNVGQTELTGVNLNAIKEWQKILEFVRSSNVIFNTIDHGDYFDYILCKVAEKYKIPLVLGGTEPFYGHTVSYFLQGIRECDPKYWDCHDLLNPQKIINFDKIEEYDDISFLPKDSHPDKGGSTVYSAGTCSHLMTSAIINYIFHLRDNERPDPPKQVIFNLMTMESNYWF